MRETEYQAKLIKRIEKALPGCMVLKNNPDHIQGIPDLLVLYRERWGALEVKLARDSEEQPNQRHYVNRMADMSYASFVSPETEKDVLNELQQALTVGRSSRVSQS